VNKRKNVILLVVFLVLMSSFILLLVSRENLSNENYMLKNRQGGIISANVTDVLGTISDAKKDLADNNISKLHRYFWQFNEYNRLELPPSITYYSINIRTDYDELIKLNHIDLSKQEKNKIESNLELHLSRLGTALALIMKECLGTDNMKFYMLNSEGNETMRNVLKILTEENNNSN